MPAWELLFRFQQDIPLRFFFFFVRKLTAGFIFFFSYLTFNKTQIPKSGNPFSLSLLWDLLFIIFTSLGKMYTNRFQKDIKNYILEQGFGVAFNPSTLPRLAPLQFRLLLLYLDLDLKKKKRNCFARSFLCVGEMDSSFQPLSDKLNSALLWAHIPDIVKKWAHKNRKYIPHNLQKEMCYTSLRNNIFPIEKKIRDKILDKELCSHVQTEEE